MQTQPSTLASRIKAIRDALNYSIEEVASKTGIAPDVYAQYEQCEQEIPVGYLTQLASFYHVDVTSILTGGDAHAHVFKLTRRNQGPVVERRKAYRYENLGAGFAGKTMEPFLVTVAPQTDAIAPLNCHPGQEFNYLLEGRLQMQIGKNTMVMECGDSVYFEAMQPHGMLALDGKPAKFLAIITPGKK